MENLFPGKCFVQYPGGKFPFPNKNFDWVFSNAVIEHVGNDDEQLLFLNEMMRVANNVFFTTPNKYFPAESHTNLFFVHWNNKLFHNWCKKFKPLANARGLNLLSFSHLHNLLKTSNATSFTVRKNRLMGIPMTFTITCTDKEHKHT